MDMCRLLELNPHALDECGDALDSIRNGQIDGIVIKNFISPNIARSSGQRLMANPDLMRNSSCPYGRIYARTLLAIGSQSTDYFADAQVFRTECEELFGMETNFETRLAELLSNIAGGRTVALPIGSGGTPYSPATIRWVEPGGTIAPHCEKVYFKPGSPPFELLNQIAAAETIFSFFMVMTKAETGGELTLYDLHWENADSPEMAKKTDPKRLDSDYNPTQIPLTEGDLIIFDAGQIWHKISEVEGKTPRLTIGGFICFTQDDRTLYYLS
jgi:hapalindole-type alkaloid chlorinase